MTTKRQEMLDLLQHHQGTLSAAEIHEALPHLDLVTIYRNLELFTNEKLIKRVFLNEKEARYEHQREPHHHAVCADCHRVIHFHAPDEQIKRLLGLEGFDIEELEVTVRGTCRKTNPTHHGNGQLRVLPRRASSSKGKLA